MKNFSMEDMISESIVNFSGSSKSLMNISVISGILFQIFHAVFFPMLLIADEKSQPQKACKRLVQDNALDLVPH